MSKSSIISGRQTPAGDVTARPAGSSSTPRRWPCRPTERVELVDLTERIAGVVDTSGVREGIVSLWSLHTTCAVFINETQKALHADIKRFLETTVSRDADWMHNDPEHSDCDRINADAHLRAMLLGHSLTLQVTRRRARARAVAARARRRARRPAHRARSAFKFMGVALIRMRARLAALGLDRHRRQARRRRAADVRRRRAAVRLPGSARARLAGESRAREAARRAHLLQLQHPARGDQRLRRELPVLLVRAAEARRRRFVHDVARAGVGQAAAARRISR